jgi:hypothetical protein
MPGTAELTDLLFQLRGVFTEPPPTLPGHDGGEVAEWPPEVLAEARLLDAAICAQLRDDTP